MAKKKKRTKAPAKPKAPAKRKKEAPARKRKAPAKATSGELGPGVLGANQQLIQYDHTGRWCLMIAEPETDEVRELFEELGLQGGGYTWEGIVNALLRERLPAHLDELEVDAEGDDMHVDCDERGPLLKVAKLVAAVAGDVARIRAIVEDEANDIE